MRFCILAWTFLLVVGIATGQQQFGFSEPPPDNIGKVLDYPPLPSSVVTYKCCPNIRVDSQDGSPPFTHQAPKGTRVILTISTKQGSGVHEHEFRFPPDPTNILAILGTPVRPQVILQSSAMQYTGDDLCAYWKVKFPEYAGWYKFDANFPDYQNDPHNYTWVRSFEWTTTPLGNKTAFIPYPEQSHRDNGGVTVLNGSAVNTMQNYWRDPWHGPLDGHEYTRWVTVHALNRFFAISKQYHAVADIVGGERDKLNILRCSLPNGGSADNGLAVSTPRGVPDTQRQPWTYPQLEAHGKGDECDILNPVLVGSQRNAQLAAQLISQNGCVLGYDGVQGQMGIDSWITSNVWHVQCLKTRGPQPVPPGNGNGR